MIKTPKMTESLARKFISEDNDACSLVYPLIRDELETYDYDDYDLPFPNEFLFFEKDYLEYYVDIIERRIPSRKVIDIGCENGIQSYIFEDYDYIGIDCIKYKWFRDKGNYINGFFQDIDLNFDDSIVISNMSLGYFNSWGNGISNEEIAEKLSVCRWLYIGTTPELLTLLKPHFKKCEYFKNDGFPRVYLEK